MGTPKPGRQPWNKPVLRPRPSLGPGMLASVTAGLAAIGVAGFACGAVLTEDAAAAEHRPVPAVAHDRAAPSNTLDPGEAAELLSANPLYATGPMEPADCREPELTHDDPESMERFLHEVTDCMDSSWQRQASASPFEVRPPVRHFWSAAGQSPCGSFPAEDTAAFYCEINSGLYLGVEDIVSRSHHSEDWESYAMLLGHEYGHHVQSEAGIMTGFRSLRAQEPDPEAGDAWTRRSELQANCLGGAFLGSAQDAYAIDEESRDRILADARSRADAEGAERRTHGTADNGELWTHHGFDRLDPAACNTWDANEELVE